MELFRKKDSRFYWYDFKARGKQYRGSTKETNKKRVGGIAALRLSQAIEGTGLLDRKAPSLQELSTRFLGWVNQQVSRARPENITQTAQNNGTLLTHPAALAGHSSRR